MPAGREGFQHVAAYDTHVAGYLRGSGDELPDVLTFAMRKQADLRYGENPHQKGALYLQTPALLDGSATVAGGATAARAGALFLNVNDIDAALATARDFAAPCCAIVKHATPVVLAGRREALEDAYRRALADRSHVRPSAARSRSTALGRGDGDRDRGASLRRRRGAGFPAGRPYGSAKEA